MYQKHFKIVLGILLGILFAGYVIYQGRYFILGPTLTLTAPLRGMQASSTILVEGRVARAVDITVDGYSIDTDQEGNFSYLLVIPHGYSILTVSARDRYGRTRTETRDLFLEQ